MSTDTDKSGLRASAVMAAGTVVSRLSGFVRIALLAALVGTSTRADLFNSANTIPNSLYILIAGGVFNAVLVPQLVRAIKHHDDGGRDFTNRVITAGLAVLAVVTLACVWLAPQVASIFMPDSFKVPAMAEQRHEIEFFCRLTLPQIFFYGAYVLFGQVLNARGSFGPMMWAPIANNVVAIGAVVVFFGVYGTGTQPSYTPGEQWLLGLGHTVGIAVQMLVLIPYLRASGYRYRPKFGLRGTGLGKTAKLGLWTIAFVAVNQVTLVIVTRLALSASAGIARGHDVAHQAVGGLTAYQNAMLVFMLPHSIVTVSLATAALPAMSALAADGKLGSMIAHSSVATRRSLALVLPAACAFVAFASPIMMLVAGWGAAEGTTIRMAQTLTVLAPGLIAFTIQFLQLRTFYAMEDTRTPFYIQCVIAAVNSSAAILGVGLLSDKTYASVVLGGSYTLAYIVGVAVGYAVLGRRTRRPPDARLAKPLAKLLAAAVLSVAAAWAVVRVAGLFTDPSSRTMAAVEMVIAVLVCLPTYAWLAKLFGASEVDEMVGTLLRRRRGNSVD